MVMKTWVLPFWVRLVVLWTGIKWSVIDQLFTLSVSFWLNILVTGYCQCCCACVSAAARVGNCQFRFGCVQSRISMAECGEDIVAPSANKAPVWKYFGYVMDLTSGREAVGKRATCKLCQVEVTHSEGRLISKTTYVPTITPNTESVWWWFGKLCGGSKPAKDACIL